MTPRHDIKALTGIRGLAALWVVIYHLHHHGLNLRHWWTRGVEHGYVAVDIFFVLSGFVMALSYGHMFAQRFTVRSYGVFLLRRFARVYPLYIVAVLAVIAGGLSGISYLLFPALAAVTLFRSTGLAVIAAVIAYLSLVGLIVDFTDHGQDLTLDRASPYSLLPVLRCLAEFTLGLAAYRAVRTLWFGEALASPVTGWIVTGVLMVLFLLPGTDISIATMIPLLIASCAACPDGLSRILASRLPVFLGDISYAVYLVHIPVSVLRQFGHDRLDGLIGHAVATAIVTPGVYGAIFVTATLCHRLIEVPARKALRSLERHLFPDASTAIVQNEEQGQWDLTAT